MKDQREILRIKYQRKAESRSLTMRMSMKRDLNLIKLTTDIDQYNTMVGEVNFIGLSETGQYAKEYL